MDIETTIKTACDAIFSDVQNAVWIAAGIAVIGAIIGIKRSLDHCSRTYRSGRRVL